MTERTKNWKGMNWIRQEKRLAIYLRDGLACIWCGEGVEEGAQLSLDHLKPHSKKGCNGESNLVTSCKRCNFSRGDRSVKEFASAVVEYLGEGDPDEVVARIQRHRRRKLPIAEAKALIERRGSAAKAIQKEM